MSGPRRPDYRLKIKSRSSDRHGDVGCGWKNEDGSISIRLNAGVVLDWRDDFFITLFERGSWGATKTDEAIDQALDVASEEK